MIITTLDLKEKYKTITDANGKVKRHIDKTYLIPLVRGVYETNSKPYDFTCCIFLWSFYLSFESPFHFTILFLKE